jgi:hypothetical protein
MIDKILENVAGESVVITVMANRETLESWVKEFNSNSDVVFNGVHGKVLYKNEVDDHFFKHSVLYNGHILHLIEDKPQLIERIL